jgi:outer membrane lipopolysaccharide assembly protein LptE/RlpB
MEVFNRKAKGFLEKNQPKFFTSHLSLFTLIMSALVISGCGYKPAARYGRDLLPDPVYVDVRLSGVEPQNGVYLKDEILRLLMSRFHERIAPDETTAVSRIIVPSYTISYSPLTYDTNGYVTRYRVTTEITFRLITPKETLNKKITSTEDVSIQPGSLTSSAAREYAIRVAIRKAMDQFLAYIARKGYGQ